MTALHSKLLKLLLTALVCFGAQLSAAEEAALIVPVEAGIHRVQLEVWNPETGEWETYSVAHLDGKAGSVKLRKPIDTPRGQWRVRATTNALIPAEWIDDDSTVKADRFLETDSSLDRPGVGGVFTSSEAEDRGGEEVVESDIWKLDGTQLYFFNHLRGLQVFDLEDPSAPVLTDTLRYPARGEQMYQLNEDYLILLARGNGDTAVELVRINDGAPYIAQSFAGLRGYYQESRLIGDRLYVVTYEYRSIDNVEGSEWKGFFQVTAIDFSTPSAPVELDKLDLEIDGGWGSTVTATSDTLMITARDRIYEETEGEWWERGWRNLSNVYLIDLDTPDGVPVLQAQAALKGYVSDKFKLRLEGDVLTAISQARGYRLETYTVEVPIFPDDPSEPPPFVPELPPALEVPSREATFSALSATRTETRTQRVWYRNTVLENLVLEDDTLTSVGTIELADGETLRATRFAGDRAYIVTFEQIDPLFIIDLSDPAAPSILGELEIPGWSNYLEVFDNDRLFSVGVEDRRVALSLFDVADPQNMSLLSRVYLGDEGSYSWTEANYDEKALSVFEDEGLALIPYQAYNYDAENYRYDMALQLVEIGADDLQLRGSLKHENRARRASLLGADTLVSVANEELITASITDLDAPVVLADLPLAWNVESVLYYDDYLLQVGRGDSVRLELDTLANQYVSYPEVRVTRSDLPDALLAEHSLAAGDVVGMTMQGPRLYVLYLDKYRDYRDESTALSQFRLHVYDFTDPLAPKELSESTFEVDLPYYHYYSGGTMKAEWKNPDTLIWMPPEKSHSYYDYWGWIGFDIGFASVRPIYDFWIPYGNNEAYLVAVDASDPTDATITDCLLLERGVEQGSVAYSEAFLVDNSIYLTESLHWWERFEIEDDEEVTSWSRFRYEHHLENTLVRVALSSDGKLSEAFRSDIVGTLTGVIPMPEDTSIVLTRERAALDTDEAAAGGRTVLQAHLFDGAQLLLIDSYAFGKDSAYDDSQQSFAFSDRVLFRAENSYKAVGEDSGEIDRIEFGYDGVFNSVGGLAVTETSGLRLNFESGHLLARSNAETLLWKIDGIDADLVGDFDPATSNAWWWWSWNRLGNPLLVPGVGLWLPAGAYGLDAFDLDNEVSMTSAAEGATAPTVWQTIASELCLETTLPANDLVGAMAELRWRFQAEDFSTVDAAAADVGDYWYLSSWYGYYHQRGDEKWIYHLDHGWLWTTGTKGEGAWTYDSEVGWCWVAETAYPFVYSAGKASWLYYFKDTTDPSIRWFYQLNGAPTGQEWFSVPQS